MRIAVHVFDFGPAVLLPWDVERRVEKKEHVETLESRISRCSRAQGSVSRSRMISWLVNCLELFLYHIASDCYKLQFGAESVMRVATETDCEKEYILYNLCSLVLCCLPSSFAACPFVLPSVPLFAWLSLHLIVVLVRACVIVCMCVSCIVHHARPLRHRRLVRQAIPETPFCAARIGHIQSPVILAWSLFR